MDSWVPAICETEKSRIFCGCVQTIFFSMTAASRVFVPEVISAFGTLTISTVTSPGVASPRRSWEGW
jgi:hypothetical protein